jgi:hypothetical protein
MNYQIFKLYFQGKVKHQGKGYKVKTFEIWKEYLYKIARLVHVVPIFQKL